MYDRHYFLDLFHLVYIILTKMEIGIESERELIFSDFI